MSVAFDSNISAEEFDNDLEIECAKIWKMQTKTMSVIVGELGMMKKGT